MPMAWLFSRSNNPFPPRIGVEDLNGYPCNAHEDFPTRDVLEKGVVAPWEVTGIQKADEWCVPDPNAPEPRAIPGEVVFFVHPLTFLQRLERNREQ